MANGSHLAKLKAGVSAWNLWRDGHPEDSPDLYGADLTGADLTGANLNGADLTYADLSGVDLTNASLANANLTGANLTRAVVKGASFQDTRLGFTILGDLDLSGARDLEGVNHLGPSTIGKDTILKSKGHIPEVFLRGCGVPGQFSHQPPSLIGPAQPILSYSVFICCSAKDQEFAKRLQADFEGRQFCRHLPSAGDRRPEQLRTSSQTRQFRCWLAPVDSQTRAKTRRTIGEIARICDLLVLILSENSWGGECEEEEFERLIMRECNERRAIVFPIRLDDAVMTVETGWIKELRIIRRIEDFRGWKDDGVYQRAFNGMMRHWFGIPLSEFMAQHPEITRYVRI